MSGRLCALPALASVLSGLSGLLLPKGVFHLDLNLHLRGCRVQLEPPYKNTVGWGTETKGADLSKFKAGRFEVKVPADVASGEGSLPGLLMATAPCPHLVERESELSGLF